MLRSRKRKPKRLNERQPKAGAHLAFWALTSLFTLTLLVWYFTINPEEWFKPDFGTLILDNKGTPISATLNKAEQFRYINTDSIPNKVKTCVLLYEDQHFYYHLGVNPVSLLSALWQAIKGRKLRGGSTISMQVVRLATGYKTKSVTRKVKEILLATRLELAYTKEEILSHYLSLAPYGGNIIGLQAASWRYFGKAPTNLSWAQAAMLAVLPNNPAQLYPGKNNNILKNKRNLLLAKLYKVAIISKETYQLSLLEPIPNRQAYFPQLAPHLLQQERNINPGGSTVLTTLNSNLQNRCNQIAEQYARNQQLTNNVNNLAILIAETETGKVLAYLGNAPGGYTPNWFVNTGTAPRSYGSLLKPFMYAAALDQGTLLPEAWLEDVPHNYRGYSPKNFYNTYQGYERANKALANSLNTCFVSLLSNYGIQRFHRLMRNYGMQLPKEAEHYGLSIALGGAESNLWELVSIYRNLGLVASANQNHLIANQIGPVFYHKPSINSNADPVKIISKQAAFLTLKAMANAKRPDLSEYWINFAERRKIAWKTGTSFGLRDAWSIGVTPKYTVGVWVGNATGEGRPNLTGILVAAPLMFQLFELLPFEKNWFPTPPLAPIQVCAITGWKATQACDSTVVTYSLPQKQSINLDCKWHKTITTNNLGTHRVHLNCYEAALATKRNALIIEGAPRWFFKEWERKNYTTAQNQYQDFPWLEGCSPNQTEAKIIYPISGSTIVPVPKKAGEALGFYAKAVNYHTNSEIYWLLNGQYLTTSKGNGHIFVPTPKGSSSHTLTLVSTYGTTHSVIFYTP